MKNLRSTETKRAAPRCVKNRDSAEAVGHSCLPHQLQLHFHFEQELLTDILCVRDSLPMAMASPAWVVSWCLAGRGTDVREKCCTPERCRLLSEDVPLLRTANNSSHVYHFKRALPCSVQGKIRMTTIYQIPTRCHALCKFFFLIHITIL